MSGNTYGRLLTVTWFGESDGPIGCIVDGCPPGMILSEADIQHDLDRRKPGKSRHTTQRREPDAVQILSGVFGAGPRERRSRGSSTMSTSDPRISPSRCPAPANTRCAASLHQFAGTRAAAARSVLRFFGKVARIMRYRPEGCR